uniref:Uncharacterized protein n=1 Tax=Rhizophora mucronata TaxID=61149 RepID=A0A2P2P480_RHIMU
MAGLVDLAGYDPMGLVQLIIIDAWCPVLPLGPKISRR